MQSPEGLLDGDDATLGAKTEKSILSDSLQLQVWCVFVWDVMRHRSKMLHV